MLVLSREPRAQTLIVFVCKVWFADAKLGFVHRSGAQVLPRHTGVVLVVGGDEMADTEESDPRKLIASFLRDLPITIQTEMLLFVILYAVRIDPPNDKNDFENVVLNYLMTTGIDSISAVIC